MRHFAGFILLVTCMALTPPPSMALGAQQSTVSASEADIVAISEQARRFSQAYMDGDIETMVDIYTADGVAAPGGRDFIRGREALSDFWALPDGVTVTHHASTPVEITVTGDYAFDWGYYEGRSGTEGNQQDFRGKYLIVWHRGEDGVWRMAHDMWNTLPRPDVP